MILKLEQPMESRRTKPYHYQCFNLEALTYIALLSQKNKSIQNAVDYLITLTNQNAGQEDKATFLPSLYKAREINLVNNGASELWTVYSIVLRV